jgi:glycosyltransferase involved in cell wall biosynthesis
MRIAVVASVIARHDAISMAARDTARALREAGFAVDLFTLRSDFPELGAHRVRDGAALGAHRAYRAADAVVCHFGVFSPIFEEIATRRGPARLVLRFHNVTPPEHVPPAQRALVERSLRQLDTLLGADAFWADSPTNAEVLTARGADRRKIEVIPLAVDRPAPATLEGKLTSPVRLLFVGRLVPSKGVLDLIETVDLVRAQGAVPFRLDIAGNEDFSDPAYAAEARAAVATRGLSEIVTFRGAVEDAELEALYRGAHLLLIPSYHEGFCRPVIEGLRAGCVPVGYAAYNLPHAAHGLGRMVRVGDREALASACLDLMSALAPRDASADSVLPLDAGPLSPSAFDAAARSYVQEFGFERVAAQTVQAVSELEQPHRGR